MTSMTEHVRTRLSRQISFANLDETGVLPLTTLAAKWEKAFNDALVGENDNVQLALAPSLIQEFTSKIRDAFDIQAREGVTTVLLTSPRIRPHVRAIIERFRPQTVVMSQNEIHPKVKIRTIAQLD